MKKKLFINARFLTQPITGVQRFAIEISKQIIKNFPDVHFIAPKNILHSDLAEEFKVITTGNFSGHLWEQLELPMFLKKQNSSYLLNLANTAPIYYPYNFIVIHDMAVFDFSSAYSSLFKEYYQFILPRIGKSAKKVFTVSSFSQERIKAHLGISSIIIPNSVNQKFSQSGTLIKDKYILAVSSLDPKKNFPGLINGFLSSNIKDHTLRVIGSSNRVFNKSSQVNHYNNITFTGYIKDEELKQLYQNATAFIYPSFYEGFGIPPLEAMASGCPTIVSDIPSLREVCGDASIYVNPYDISDIANKLREVCYNSELQTYLHKKGLENIRRFSWEDSSLKLMHYISETMQ